jgi:hypothetical protein
VEDITQALWGTWVPSGKVKGVAATLKAIQAQEYALAAKEKPSK